MFKVTQLAGGMSCLVIKTSAVYTTAQCLLTLVQMRRPKSSQALARMDVKETHSKIAQPISARGQSEEEWEAFRDVHTKRGKSGRKGGIKVTHSGEHQNTKP